MRIFPAMLLCALLMACAPTIDIEDRPSYCDQDNLICPDGSIVMRTGPDCEFACPEAAKDACGHVEADTQYWHHDLRECASSEPKCDPGWVVFSDNCGCGCQKG